MSHMQSKLEELARKEEELRRINEALNIKNTKIIPDDVLADSKGQPDMDEEEKFSDADSDDQFKGQNLAKGKFLAAAAAFDDEYDEYGDGNFEKDAAANTGKSSKHKSKTVTAAEDVDPRKSSSSAAFKDKF